MRLAFVLVFGAAVACASPALAFNELRLGIAAHNVRFGSSDTQSEERGPNVEAETVAKPLPLGWAGHPRPYGMVSANTNGDTSYAAAGLYWSVPISENWRVEPGLGLAIHDGALHNPYASDDPNAERFARRHQLLGSRVLFRDTLSLRRELRNGAAIGIMFEHLSNGGELFGHRDNQSLNELGVWCAHPFR